MQRLGAAWNGAATQGHDPLPHDYSRLASCLGAGAAPLFTADFPAGVELVVRAGCADAAPLLTADWAAALDVAAPPVNVPGTRFRARISHVRQGLP